MGFEQEGDRVEDCEETVGCEVGCRLRKGAPATLDLVVGRLGWVIGGVREDSMLESTITLSGSHVGFERYILSTF